MASKVLQSVCKQCTRGFGSLRGGSGGIRFVPRGVSVLPQILGNHARTISISCQRPMPIQNNIVSSVSAQVDIRDDIPLAKFIMEDWEKFGDQVGLVNGVTGEKFTYRDLKAKVRKAASSMVKLGVKPGDVITMSLPNCPEFCIAFLAAISIGAVISAVNPLYTPTELTHAINHSGAKLLITHPMLLPVATEAIKECPQVKEVITVGDAPGHRPFSSLLEDDGSAFPDNIHIDPKSLVALPYSSGTTGLPKGVMLSNYNLVANIQQCSEEHVGAYSSNDTLVGVLPFYHIYGLTIVMLLNLRAGGKLVTVPKFDPELFLKVTQEYKATWMHLVPPIVLFLAKHPLVDKFDFSSVHTVVTAAAPVGKEMVEGMYARLKNPNVKVRQGYGMTETSPITHVNTPTKIKLESIGLVCPNTFSKVVDLNSGEALGPGEEGEICMKGPQVMMGYLNNQEATDNTVDKEGWLHSGDIGYYDSDEFFYVTDRLKELIKVKGYQVAPAELEALLLTNPSVQDAAVISIPDERAGELPRAYVVLKPDANMSEDDVKDFVKGKVANYKELAGGVEFRKEIPKSNAGKILRRLLKDEYLGK